MTGGIRKRSNCGIVYKSWGDEVRAYANKKTTLPWAPDKYDPTHYRHVTKYEMSRKEREWDPVLGHYRDTQRDQEYAKQVASKREAERKAGRSKQLRFEHQWNILSNEVHPDVTVHPTPQLQARHPDTLIHYNIVNGINKTKAKELPLILTPRELSKFSPTPRKVTISGGKLPYSHHRRDFDILNNHYTHDHEQKLDHDYELSRHEAQVKFWKTHDYDLIQGVYYDQDKEKAFQDQRLATEKVHGHSKLAREPPSYQYSEGRVFNLVTGAVVDPIRSQVIVGKQSRSTKNKIGPTFEKNTRLRREQRDDVEAVRRMNRISWKRYESQRDRGYNLITNTPYTGEGCVPYREPHILLPVRSWTKLATVPPHHPSSSSPPPPLSAPPLFPGPTLISSRGAGSSSKNKLPTNDSTTTINNNNNQIQQEVDSGTMAESSKQRPPSVPTLKIPSAA